jgi:hypothetical protein
MLALICRFNLLNKTGTFSQEAAERKPASLHWSADSGIASSIASSARRCSGLRSDTLADGIEAGRGE